MRFVVGFQSGADMGAALAAKDLGIHVSGYVPKGRKNEDGVIGPDWECQELPNDSYPARTILNVEHSHAVIIFGRGGIQTPGSKLAMSTATHQLKPVRYVDLLSSYTPLALGDWLRSLDRVFISWQTKGVYPHLILNIAGTRESKAPGIQEEVRNFVSEAIRAL